MTCSVVPSLVAMSLFLKPCTMSATILSSLGVRRSRTRAPTASFSLDATSDSLLWIHGWPLETVRTHSTSAGPLTLRKMTPCTPWLVYCEPFSPDSAMATSLVLFFFAASVSFSRSECNAMAKMSTFARKSCSALIILSEVSAWATTRRSSSTARTLAAPARNIAWLSARMIFNMVLIALLPNFSFYGKLLFRLAHELVVVDHAGHTLLAVLLLGRVALGRVHADYAAFAVDADVGLGAED